MPRRGKWYDGYRFEEQEVYCSWDVINYCSDLVVDGDAKPQAYWLNTSGNDMVRGLIDKVEDEASEAKIETLIAGGILSKRLNERLTHNVIDKNINNIWSLLFMTGYLTMWKKPSMGVYDLKLPNREVRQINIEQVPTWFKNKAKAEVKSLTELYAAFGKGDAVKIKGMLDDQLLHTISCHDAHESFYHGFLLMLALLSTCADWSVVSNAETGKAVVTSR